jgi:hypothetical protein
MFYFCSTFSLEKIKEVSLLDIGNILFTKRYEAREYTVYEFPVF